MPRRSPADNRLDDVVQPADPADDVVLADELFVATGLLRRTVRRATGQPWPNEELTGAQRELVRLLRRQPGTSVAEAAAELWLRPNTVSTLVRQLVDAGLITRTPDHQDRRVARLRLTAPASGQIERWRDERTSLAAQAIAGLEAEQRSVLVSAIEVITKLAAEIDLSVRGQAAAAANSRERYG